MYSLILAFFAVRLAVALPHIRRQSSGPVISSNFQDPSIIKVGNTWYAYSGPNGNPAVNVQIATSPDFASWSVQGGVDVLPDAGPWAASTPHVWAPDVNQLANGQFVLYYAASSASSPNHHCVGAATSTSVTGPYTPMDSPMFCDLTTGGSIDPNGAVDPETGNMYVVYKVDGNSLGHGGACGNSVAPIQPTPIILQQVSAIDGVTPIGGGIEILVNESQDGPMVEAPALMYDSQSGGYVLFYNSGCFTDTSYTIRYAVSMGGIGGPYARQGTFAATGSTSANVQIPGGIDVAGDGVHAVFHGDINLAWFNDESGNSDGKRVRAMYAVELDLSGGSVSPGTFL